MPAARLSDIVADKTQRSAQLLADARTARAAHALMLPDRDLDVPASPLSAAPSPLAAPVATPATAPAGPHVASSTDAGTPNTGATLVMAGQSPIAEPTGWQLGPDYGTGDAVGALQAAAVYVM